MSDNGSTALIAAAGLAEPRLLGFLIQAGATVNHQNKNGYTALLAAVDTMRPEIIKLLLSKGARTDQRTRFDRTAKTIADMHKPDENYDTVIRLLQATDG